VDAGGAALTGSTNNTITTVTGANAIQGEANLTFDGSNLNVTGQVNPTGDIDLDNNQAYRSAGEALLARYSPIIELGSGQANDYLKLKAGGAEQVRIHTNGVMSASDGVALGVGTANTASNVLDDFEEGTYTYAMTTAGGGTVSNRSGYDKLAYTKIGRMVNVVGKIETNGLGDFASQNGDIRLSLPFAIGNFDDFAEQFSSPVMWFNTASMSSMNMLFWSGASNDSFCTLVNISSTLGDSAIQGNQPGSSFEMKVNITYQAA
jgi:hypothetical protein